VAGGLEVADAYAKAVVQGGVVANLRIRAQAARYLEARRTDAWDGARLDRLLEHARKVYGWELMPWAVWAFAHLVAWRNADQPAARFVVLQVARGVGKTQMAAMLASWTVEEAARDGRKNCEVVVLATQMDKAALVQERIREAMGEETEWEFYGGKMSTVGALATHPGGSIKCRPSTVKNADGITPTLLICDEAARMDDTFTRAITSLTKVRGAQMLVITTPDARQYENPYGSMIRGIERSLDGNEPMPTGTVGLIYGIDPDDAPDDREAWIKACPSMGVHKTVADYELVMAQTLNSGVPAFREEWYTQQLATFADDLAGGLPLALFDACVEPWELESARNLPGVIAVDFSQGGWASKGQFDLTSMNLAVWNGQRLLSRSWHYWAGSDLVSDEVRSRQPLRDWRDKLHLNVMGNTVDYSVLEGQIQALARVVDLKFFTADPAGKAAAWCESMERKHGWQWTRAPQNVVFMGSAWAIWADMVRGRRIQFDSDPVLRANLAHTKLRPGDTGLFVPSKGRSESNIDAVTACCMAVKVLNDREMLAESAYGTDPSRIVI
jgi:phage terminase large subunit-like protein